jgi:hypothetical protein
MLRIDRLFSGTALAASLLTAACSAQPTAAPAWQVDALEAAAVQLEENYIYEARGHALAEMLRGSQAQYVDIAVRADFARAVTRDLYAEVSDAHLRVFHEPEAGREVESDRETPDPTRAARLQNCRTAPVVHDRLAGDVGYVTVPRFFGGEDYVAALDAAVAAHNDASAMILDLRNNCGGGPSILRHLATYFFSEPTHLTSTEMRGEAPGERWTLPDVPGPRFVDRPLIILTNGNTFSAGESFTFGMKVTGRALTAGETTGGGGHFGDTVRLTPDFTLFVPVGRTFDPRTGEGWENTGIAPDIAATSDDALEAALDYLAGL